MKKILVVFMLLFLFWSCEQRGREIVTMETSLGTIQLKLYEETPLHRDNFMKLVKEGYFDSMLFHRVIADFMIQAGDPDSKNAQAGMVLGENSINYTIKAEFNPNFFHRKGVLAAAREGDEVNPERNSSGSHFYIAQGKVYTPEKLDSLVEVINQRRYKALVRRLEMRYQEQLSMYAEENRQDSLMKINDAIATEAKGLFENERLVLSEEQRKVYTTVGGIPHLDGAYTVFGEVVSGIDVLDQIAMVQTDTNDRPVKDVVILKMKVE